MIAAAVPLAMWGAIAAPRAIQGAGLPALLSPPRTGSLVTGGPFQRMVYNTRTHIALAIPGRFSDGSLSIESASIQYNDNTHVAWTNGPCSVVDGGASATASSGSADFGRRTITLDGGVRFHLPAAADNGRQITLDLLCPVLTYSSLSGSVQCLGGVSGQVTGIEDLPGAVIGSLSAAGGGQAAAPGGRGPVLVTASTVAFDPRTRTLTAGGGVQLRQHATTLRSQSLSLDVGRRVLRMQGMVGYSDSTGRTLEGAAAAENLQTRTVLIQGPLQYHDQKGNSVQAASAALDQRSNVATLTGNVRFTDAQGLSAETPFVVIGFDSRGAQSIRTGPIRIHGTLSSSRL